MMIFYLNFIRGVLAFSLMFISQTLVLAQSVNTERITFRDIDLGVEGVKDKFSEICKENISNTRDKDKRCNLEKNSELIWLTYGNLQHELATVSISKNGALEEVEFNSAPTVSVLVLAELLSEKYGKPHKETSSVSNRIGNKFDKHTFTWIDLKGNAIIIESLNRKVGEGKVLILSGERLKAMNVINKLITESQKSKL
jgi:hypothetical protein